MENPANDEVLLAACRKEVVEERASVLKAAGLTLSELDSVLTTAYSRDYLNPDLSVIMRSEAEKLGLEIRAARLVISTSTTGAPGPVRITLA